MKKTMKPFSKKLLIILVVLLVLAPATAFASPNKGNIPITVVHPSQSFSFNESIEVTSDGGKFVIGFTKIDFKKNLLADKDMPIVFNVDIYAENGLVYIEFNPSVSEFTKDVKVHVFRYSGYIYDRATGENIYVEIPNQVLKIPHFSRYCFVF